MYLNIATLGVVLFLNIKPVYCQKTPAIFSCLEVQCPVDDSNLTSTCTVADVTYKGNVIGVAPIPVLNDNLKGVSWTEGVLIADREGGGLDFRTNYYFGTPPEKNFTGTGACAVFFNEVSNNVNFPPWNNSLGPDPMGEGTCDDAMLNKCVDALTTRAEKLDVSGLGSSAACDKLQTAFTENFDLDCELSSTTGKNWSGITVAALTGPDAAAPITEAQNSTSNCWPVLPKNNDLALANTFNDMGSTNFQNSNIFKITPILTLFYPGNGSLVTKSEAQLTCMKPIKMGVRENSTMGKLDDDGAGVAYRPSIAYVFTCLGMLIVLTSIM